MLDDVAGAGTLASQYAVAIISGGTYAIRLELISEIIQVPRIVAAPMAPPALLGYCNLRGSVIPVLDGGELLGVERGRVDAESRILVCGGESRFGVLIDRLVSICKVSVDLTLTTIGHDRADGDSIVPVQSIAIHEGRPCKVIDLENLARSVKFDRFRLETRRPGTRKPPARSQEEDAAPAAETSSLFTFRIDGHDMAVETAQVAEVASLEAADISFAEAGGLVAGFVEHKGHTLPILNPARILPGHRPGSDGRLLLRAMLSDDPDRRCIGLIVDAVTGLVDAPTEVVAAGDPGRARYTLPRLIDGNRICQVLDLQAIARVIETTTAPEHNVQHPTDAADPQTPPAAAPLPGPDDPARDRIFLIFQRHGQDYAVPIERVSEVLSWPQNITRLPNAKPQFIGVTNLRGSVLPILSIDRPGDTSPAPEAQAANPQIVVINAGDAMFGIRVDTVSEVYTAAEGRIEPADPRSGEAGEDLAGILNLADEGRIVLIMNPEAYL